jgi:amino acid transporter
MDHVACRRERGAVEVMAALQYASNNIGGLTHIPAGSGGNPVLTFPLGYILAVVLLGIFCWINLIGIRAFARLNTRSCGGSSS